MRNARLVLVWLLAVLATACASNATATTATSPSVSRRASATADAINPSSPQRSFIYGSAASTVASVRVSSRKLVSGLRLPAGADVVPIESTAGTTAVEVIERDPPGRFGNLLPAAQRALFERFASDPHLGGWLIVVTTLHGKDSSLSPPVADRWQRAAVEAYVRCGIPSTGTNACKAAFMAKSKEVTLLEGGMQGGQ